MAEAGARPPSNLAAVGDVWLDVSRTLWRVQRGALTGIDRVEIAYAENLLDLAPERLRFVAFDYWRGRFGLLPWCRTAALLRRVGPCWCDGRLGDLKGQAMRLFAGSLLAARKLRAARHATVRPTYLNVSGHPLQLVAPVRRMLRRTGAAFVPLVHDLIPLDHPEYVPPAWTRHHRRRIESAACLADGVIANSAATAAALRTYLPGGLPVLAAPLGAPPPGPPARLPAPGGRPYFLCLGTIEPRKNHITLLNVWRRLAETVGADAPHLIIVGRRGWMNEHVLNMIERCGSIRPLIEERGVLSDSDVARLMAGARALLMPSFAEGYGLPVAEALARGVPVVCSDIPAHREIGGGVPDYIDPLDSPAWGATVLEYAKPGSVRRAAQLARMRGWRCPTWGEHVASALGFVDDVARRSIRPADAALGDDNGMPPRFQVVGGLAA